MKEEAWKNQDSNGIQTRYLRDTGAMPAANWAMKPHFGSEAISLSSYLPWGVKWCGVYMK